MRIESNVIPTSAPADLQAVSIDCKPEKTELLASLMAPMEAPGVPASNAGAHDKAQDFLQSRGFRSGDWRSSSAERRPGAPHLDLYQHIRLEEENLIREPRNAAEPSR